MLSFCDLSVCVTFVRCAQLEEDIDTISFHTTAPCLSLIALEFVLYLSPFVP